MRLLLLSALARCPAPAARLLLEEPRAASDPTLRAAAARALRASSAAKPAR